MLSLSRLCSTLSLSRSSKDRPRKVNKLNSKTFQRLANIVKTQAVSGAASRKKTMINFAEKHGLVYFGYVNQRTDEHRLVRGMTSAPNHRDNHYCIGSVDGYDVVLVERQTEITHPGKLPHATTWAILTVDLRRRKDMPHVFFDAGPRNETFYANLFTKFSKLKRVDFSTIAIHDHEFLTNYQIYAPLDRAIEAEQIFTTDITRNLGQHFMPLDIEVEDDTLYLYADDMQITPELLEAILKNGLWLANQLDLSINKHANPPSSLA